MIDPKDPFGPINKFTEWVMGKPEDIDKLKKLKGSHYLIIAIKLLTPIIGTIFLLKGRYAFAICMYIAFLFDIYFAYDLGKRYKAYKEMKEIKFIPIKNQYGK